MRPCSQITIIGASKGLQSGVTEGHIVSDLWRTMIMSSVTKADAKHMGPLIQI